MPSSKDLTWTRSSLMTVVVAVALSLAGLGCTQMPPRAVHVRIYETSADIRSVERDASRAVTLDESSVRALAPDEWSGRESDGRRGSGARAARRARSTPVALAGARANNGAAGIRRVQQVSPRGRPAGNRNAIDPSGRSGRTPVAVVDSRARNPDGESPRLVLSGASADAGLLTDGVEAGSPAPSVGAMDSPESSSSSPSSSSPSSSSPSSSSPASTAERTVLRGGQSGDHVTEMTRFVRPEEPRRRPPSLNTPRQFRTLFSDSPVIPLPEPRSIYSSTRCGHRRF